MAMVSTEHKDNKSLAKFKWLVFFYPSKAI